MVKEFLPEAGYRHIAVGPGNDTRGIAVGVISRVSIDSVTTYHHRTLTLPGEEKTWQFARSLIEVKLRLAGDRTLSVFVVHLKSKRDSEGDRQSAKWRLAEAMEIARELRARRAKDPEAWYLVAGDFNDLPGSPPLAALVGDGEGKPAVLVDVHAKMDPEKRITYLREPYRNNGPIDFILASPALARRVVAGSATVISDGKLLEGSDHAPVMVTFDVK